MFSKSSECNIVMPNEYLCTKTCGTLEGYGPSPFCATMGQPLIYYCQTQPQQKCTQRSENARRDNRNFFTKAFQWYTEEHVPHVREECTKKSADVKGFANWLDSKYDQFVQDQCDTCGYKVKHTSITEAYRFPNEPCCETRRKKFRVKSPWRKKRGHKDTGDVTSKSSLHYIMKPKDISRPASETNEMSKSMMMSSEVVLSRYSHSCTSLRILREPSVTAVKRTQETVQSSNSIKVNKNAKTKSLSKMGPEEPKNVLCLCSKVTKKNASSQSDPWPVKSSSKSVPKVETHCQTLPKSESPPKCVPKAETHCQTLPKSESHPKCVPKAETHCQTLPKSESPPKCVPKAETHCQTLPKSESPLQPAQNAAPCQCRPSKFTKVSHPTKIEIEFETKPSVTQMESFQCQCSNEFIPKADAQSQFETDDKTCACGPDNSFRQEEVQIIPKPTTLELRPCKCNYMDFVKCPLEPQITNPIQNQQINCNQCIPCKKTTTINDDRKMANPSNKTTPGGTNGLDSNPSNKKTTGGYGISAANPTTTNDGVQASNQTTIANDGVQTSNQTTIANDGVQTSNHSIRIDKDGAATAGAHPLFMKIVFADKLCKF